MKRSLLIIFGGLVLAVCAYLCIYFGKTAAERSVERSDPRNWRGYKWSFISPTHSWPA